MRITLTVTEPVKKTAEWGQIYSVPNAQVELLTHSPLEDAPVALNYEWGISWAFPVKLPSGQCHA